jgi:hypothetical protein
MGVIVRFKSYVKKSGDRAEWTLDGKEITIFTEKNDSKIQLILSLIHELGHHKGFVNNGRKLDPKVDEALGDEEERKVSRRRIYLDEAKDAEYWEEIYNDTNCNFPINKLYLQKEFDIWSYEFYYENGNFPDNKDRAKKMKELKNKYRRKNG